MEKLSQDEEKRIINDAKKDPEKFGTLYDTYANAVFNFVLRRVNDTNIAEDITADTFYKALRSIKQFNFKSSFSTYLFKIAKNEIYSFYRRKRFFPALFPASEAFYDAGCKKNPETEKLTQAIEKLPFREREIIRMHFIEEKGQREISFILNIGRSTYYKLMQSALSKLKKMIKGDENEGR